MWSRGAGEPTDPGGLPIRLTGASASRRMAVMANTSPLEAIRSTVSGAAERVFLSPIQQDGLTVIPAATVGAGGGGGGGSGPEQDGTPTGTGEGGGFGLSAKPAGAFVIKDGAVSWRPAVDVNRLALGGQIVAVVALLVVRTIFKNRAKRRLYEIDENSRHEQSRHEHGRGGRRGRREHEHEHHEHAGHEHGRRGRREHGHHDPAMHHALHDLELRNRAMIEHALRDRVLLDRAMLGRVMKLSAIKDRSMLRQAMRARASKLASSGHRHH